MLQFNLYKYDVTVLYSSGRCHPRIITVFHTVRPGTDFNMFCCIQGDYDTHTEMHYTEVQKTMSQLAFSKSLIGNNDLETCCVNFNFFSSIKIELAH